MNWSAAATQQLNGSIGWRRNKKMPADDHGQTVGPSIYTRKITKIERTLYSERKSVIGLQTGRPTLTDVDLDSQQENIVGSNGIIMVSSDRVESFEIHKRCDIKM